MTSPSKRAQHQQARTHARHTATGTTVAQLPEPVPELEHAYRSQHDHYEPGQHMGHVGRDMGRRWSTPKHTTIRWPSTWSFLAPPVGIEPTTCGLGNAVETVSASHLESHLTCSASVFSSSGLVEHHAVARRRWTSGWTTFGGRRRRPGLGETLKAGCERGSEKPHVTRRRWSLRGRTTGRMAILTAAESRRPAGHLVSVTSS